LRPRQYLTLSPSGSPRVSDGRARVTYDLPMRFLLHESATFASRMVCRPIVNSWKQRLKWVLRPLGKLAMAEQSS